MDLARLARAVHLSADAEAPGRWVVRGGAAPHEVMETSPGVFACGCADAAMRADVVECKHVLRVRLAQGDPAVLEALRALVPMPKASRPPRKRVAP